MLHSHSDGIIRAKACVKAALSEREIATLRTTMRQVGVGSQGGPGALAIFHELMFDEWMSESLGTPLARIKSRRKYCFGVECNEELLTQTRSNSRMEASRSLLCGSRRSRTNTNRSRSRKKGYIDGPWECSLALGVVAAEARSHVAGHLTAGIVPGVGASSIEEMRRTQDKYQSTMHLLQHFQPGEPRKAHRSR